jgi:hypothetical protein
MQPPNLVVSGTPEVGLAFRHDSFCGGKLLSICKKGILPAS